MPAPLAAFGLVSDATALGIGVVVGVCFGAILERAGFGHARHLAAQFYLRDLRVLKVIFSAMATAAIGLGLLDGMGWIVLDQIFMEPTFPVADVLGGLLLGAGFLLSGYCPGTSVVAFASGHLDGAACMLGLGVGMVLCGFADPGITSIQHLCAWGPMTLPQAMGVPYSWVVAGVPVLAGGAFIAAEWAEVRWGGHQRESRDLIGRSARAPGRIMMVGLLMGACVVIWLGERPVVPSATSPAGTLTTVFLEGQATLTPTDVADLLMANGHGSSVVVDLRRTPEHAERLPGAIAVPPTACATYAWPRHQRLVLCGDTEAQVAQAAMLLKANGLSAVTIMAGGWEAWRHDVLYPLIPETASGAAPDPALERRKAISRYFGGHPIRSPVTMPSLPSVSPPPPIPTSPPTPTPSQQRLRGGCS